MRINKIQRVQMALALALMASGGELAKADAIYYVTTTYGQTNTGSTAVSTSGQLNGSGGLLLQLTGGATAAPGVLGAVSGATLEGFSGSCPGGFCGWSVSSEAQLTLDDVVFSGPTDSVTTALNLALAGSMSATASAGGAFQYGAEGAANVTFDGYLTDNDQFAFEFGGSMSNNQWNGSYVSGTSCFTSSGLLGDTQGCGSAVESVGSTVGTDQFDVPIGVPLTLVMTLNTNAGVAGYVNGNGSADATGGANFIDTVSFPFSGVVFDLPDGYTVNSAEGMIVDNHFVGAENTSAVPEPGSLPILLAGFAAIALLHLRRRLPAQK
ncbi:MAG TPA: PEP-CTERM sorting domain-containing protein [Bryobacteraceae bacterium]|nr:PEP-CTERM sorting domain-containing protein [Bryobacteraceae bacterium]